MINWTEMSGLHVIAKLEEVLGKWFGVELIYADQYSKIRSKHLDRDFEFVNHFTKVQMGLEYGYEYLIQDIEKVTEHLASSDKDTWFFHTYFPAIRGIASKIVVDGEYLGTVIAYPYVSDQTTAEEFEALKSKLTECGASKEDVEQSIAHLNKMTKADYEYLNELVSLLAGEIATYHAEISKREDRIHELNSELGDKFRYHNMIGKSKKMQAIYGLLQKISNSDSSVFIQGDNGTGKELVAKAVHFSSPRKDKAFLAVNCSAFNDNLLDSELFGHVKGSFTGAVKDKKGLFEQADGGTLFLDEIGDTSLAMQVKLLRVLQEGTFLPVGATTPKKCDVRIVAATNRNIKEMMANGLFREDLFYRINVININLPSLRERPEDIPLLMDYFLQKRCAESGMPTKVISKKCMEQLLNYPWPGNVRELENEIERLVVLSGEEKTITPDLLSPRIQDHGDAKIQSSGSGHGINMTGTLKDALEEVEALMIREGLKRCNFNKSRLAKELGVSRASLIMKVEKYGLDKRMKAANE